MFLGNFLCGAIVNINYKIKIMNIGIISSTSISNVSDFMCKIRKSLTVDTEKAVYADDIRASFGSSFESVPDYSEILNIIKRNDNNKRRRRCTNNT